MNEEQKPNPNDPQFVGRKDVFKYIAIHGFAKFQKDKQGMLKDGSREWIKESTRKDSDPDYAALTMLQRETLSGLRRLRGLHGKNPVNDPTMVARGLQTLPTERSHVSHAIRRLVSDGLVSLTNQRVDFQEVVEVVEVEEVKAAKPSTPPVQSRKSKEPEPRPTPPAVAKSTCTRGHKENQSWCLECNPPATKKPAVAAPAPKVRGWDVHEEAPFGDYTKEDILFVVSWFWDNPKAEQWYKENVFGTARFQKKFAEMIGKIPRTWTPNTKVKLPTAKSKKSFRPDGTEYPGGWNDGDYCVDCEGSGQRRDGTYCPCTKWYLADGTEISAEENLRRLNA